MSMDFETKVGLIILLAILLFFIVGLTVGAGVAYIVIHFLIKLLTLAW